MPLLVVFVVIIIISFVSSIEYFYDLATDNNNWENSEWII